MHVKQEAHRTQLEKNAFFFCSYPCPFQEEDKRQHLSGRLQALKTLDMAAKAL